MKQMLSRFGLASALGALTFSLGAGPGSATNFGGLPINEVIDKTVVGTVSQVPVSPSPSSVNMGTLEAYKNQRRTALVKIYSPTAGYVVAWANSGKAFQVTRLSNYVFRLTGRLLRDQTVTGNGRLPVGQGQLLEVEVALQSAANQASTLDDTLIISGYRWTAYVPLRAFVLQQPEIVPSVDNGEVKIAPGGQARLVVHLNRTLTQSFTGPSGVDQDVTITAQDAPAGVSIDPVTVRVPADSFTVDAIVPFHANGGTPVGPGQPMTLQVTYGGESQALDLAANVYPTTTTWHYDQQIGDVHHEGDLTIHSDGTWKWTAHLHDKGVIYGDYFSVGVWINTPYTGYPDSYSGSFPGGWVTGSLGGGVFGGSQDQDIEMSSDQPTLDPYYNPAGPSQWLQAHYIEAVDAGCVADGNASDDPTGLMKWVLGKMATVVGGAIGL